MWVLLLVNIIFLPCIYRSPILPEHLPPGHLHRHPHPKKPRPVQVSDSVLGVRVIQELAEAIIVLQYNLIQLIILL